MTTKKRILLLASLAALALALVVGGCAAPEPKAEEPSPPAQAPSESPSGDAAGLRLAPGLYDIEDGKVQALGILEYRDLEGGFWAVTDTTVTEGGEAKVVAVIANSDYFMRQLEPLKGKTVNVIGKRLDGASIRMAGPEIEVESITEMTDTPGISE